MNVVIEWMYSYTGIGQAEPPDPVHPGRFLILVPRAVGMAAGCARLNQPQTDFCCRPIRTAALTLTCSYQGREGIPIRNHAQMCISGLVGPRIVIAHQSEMGISSSLLSIRVGLDIA